MSSPQTLTQAQRRIAAAWAADCAERVLALFEAEVPGDPRPREAIARTRAFARGELPIAEEIRRRFEGGGAGRDLSSPAAAAAARAAGQASGVSHMGAHALGAAAYAAKAAGLAAARTAAEHATEDATDQVTALGQAATGQATALEQATATEAEIAWQLGHLSPPARAALALLPPVGENRSGPLGPGLLASGLLGSIIRDLQTGLSEAQPQPQERATTRLR